MMASSVLVFQTLASKAGQGPEPPVELVEEIKKQDGFRRAYFGVSMEDPDTGVLCTEWTSREPALRYRSSGVDANTFKETLVMFVAGTSPSRGSALEAPCTEVFTAFGAEERFRENVGRFVEAVERMPPEGYLGAWFGESVEEEEEGEGEKGVREGGEKEEGGQGRVVRMLLGWTSREAHLAAKGVPGAIQENIHELRTLRRSVGLFHVQFKKL